MSWNMMMSYRKIALVTTLIPFVFGSIGNSSYGQAGDLELACCTETELTYMNGEIRLAGVLLTPIESGEYPAAVLLHGSGTSDRSNGWARSIAETLVSKGVAVLLTDKRGSGQSQGNWRTSSFEDLAKDGLAGIVALRGIEGIRKDRLGFIGLSQGGHIAPLAAVMGEVQFVINFVGGTLPMKAMLFHELEQTYKQLGIDDTDVDYLQQMTALSFAYIETGEGFDDYLAYRDTVTERYGAMATDSWPTTTDDDYWTFWRLIYDFDPMPYWREVVDLEKTPAFVAYGELDEADNVPVSASVRRFEEELDGATLTVRVYPDTGHSLMDEDLMNEHRYQLVDGLLHDLDVWIDANILR
jgi:pimeloyl-ACP methyl ester carboxylesterase